MAELRAFSISGDRRGVFTLCKIKRADNGPRIREGCSSRLLTFTVAIKYDEPFGGQTASRSRYHSLSLFEPLPSASRRMMHEFERARSDETAASLRNGGKRLFSLFRFAPFLQFNDT